MDINLTISSIFVIAGNWGCVATPNSILVRANEQCEFSSAESENPNSKMPPRITWNEDNPKIERHGFTDYLETNKGFKPIRIFDGRGQGRFRLTRVGKRFYHKHTLNEYVIQLPALFLCGTLGF